MDKKWEYDSFVAKAVWSEKKIAFFFFLKKNDLHFSAFLYI